MDVVNPRCAGLAVHKQTVVACVLRTQEDGTVKKQVRTFGTMTGSLLALGDWLDELGVTAVAMESSGIYWRPVFNLLEDDQRTILLVNAQHVKGLPGRKTDVQDSEWLAALLRHGLLKPSFVPPKAIRELREFTRSRKALVAEHTAEVNRLQKVLETANSKVAAVASTVRGLSVQHMLTAIIAGEDDPAVLADLALGRLRAKLPLLRQALEGRVQSHHRVLLERILIHLDFLEESIAQLQEQIELLLPPVEEAVTLLQTIPGIGPVAAQAIVAEIGADMERFPSEKRLASWAGVCPGNHQSGGKRLSGKTTKGDTSLRAILGDMVLALTRTRDNYLVARYHRIACRRGQPKAMMALAHSLVIRIYHVLRRHKPYVDLGADYFDKLDAERLQRHHVRRLEQLGYDVTITKRSA